MQSIANFLLWVNNNWTFIIICIGLGLGIYKKVKNYSKLTTEEKINRALVSVKSILLEKMATAEIDWSDYKKSGELKKSQVISDIYAQFPVLKEYIDQETLIKEITQMIDDSMGDMNKIVNNLDNTTNEMEE